MPNNQATQFLQSSEYQKTKQQLLELAQTASEKVRGVRAGDSGPAREAFVAELAVFQKNRGRDLYYPILGSGLGCGPFYELQDGSVKYDMITGIGIGFFGHSHPQLMAETLDAMTSDIMQGGLMPSVEAPALLEALLSRVRPGTRLAHGWFTTCGTMANEYALKIVRQKKSPATKILAIQDCFSGRSTAMQEITDNPKYREGQPVYGEVDYLPSYRSDWDLEANIQATLARFVEVTQRYPGKYAALMMELVQGEGGFVYGPRDYYVKLFEAARKAGLLIWIDEVQTFGRTGELFAFQTFGLQEYVDIVTVGKTLQACAVIYTAELNPKPGLIAGTFSGSSVALRTGRRVLELFDEQKLLGQGGGVQRLADRFSKGLKQIQESTGLVNEVRVIGGMIAFKPFQGTMDQVKVLLTKMFDQGVIAFYCGHGPYLVRMLPPLAAMTEADVDEVLRLIGESIKQVSHEKGWSK